MFSGVGVCWGGLSSLFARLIPGDENDCITAAIIRLFQDRRLREENQPPWETGPLGCIPDPQWYSLALSCFTVLGIEPRTRHTLGKHSIAELHPSLTKELMNQRNISEQGTHIWSCHGDSGRSGDPRGLQKVQGKFYPTACKICPRNFRASLPGDFNRPPTRTPFERARQEAQWVRLEMNLPTCALPLEVNASEPSCHRFPWGQLPTWQMPTGSSLGNETVLGNTGGLPALSMLATKHFPESSVLIVSTQKKPRE